MQILKIFGILLLIPIQILAQQVTKVGTTAAGFLNLDIGARAVGMGSAYVAATDEISASYWNPAGLARIKATEATFCHNRWLADVALNYAAVGLNLGRTGVLALSAAFLTMAEMERTTILEPDGTGETFSAGSYVFSLGYARDLTDRFAIGFNFKYISENIYHSRAQGAAFDIGTLYRTQIQGLKIGMSISNYGTKMQMSGRDLLLQADIDPAVHGNNPNINASLQTDRYDLPLMFRVGIALEVFNGLANSRLTFALDALHPNDDVESINLGCEYNFKNRLALRAGYKSLFARDAEEGLSLGVGLQSGIAGQARLHLDYAYRDFGVLNDIQMLSLSLAF